MSRFVRKFPIPVYSSVTTYLKYDVVKIVGAEESYFVSISDNNTNQLGSTDTSNNFYWKNFDTLDFSEVWTPSYSSSIESKTKVIDSTLEGVTLLGKDGENNISLGFSMKFEEIGNKEAKSILCFFDYVGISGNFYFTLPTPYNKKIMLNCVDLTHTFSKYQNNSISVSTSQDYNVNQIELAQKPVKNPCEYDKDAIPLISISFSSQSAPFLRMFGATGYRPTGNTQLYNDPTAPWNTGPIWKWNRRVFSGNMSRRGGLCLTGCQTVIGQNFYSIEYADGYTYINNLGVATYTGSLKRYDSDYPDCGVPPPPLVATYTLKHLMTDAGWSLQSTECLPAVVALTSLSIIGGDCYCAQPFSNKYYGATYEILESPVSFNDATLNGIITSGTASSSFQNITGSSDWQLPESEGPITFNGSFQKSTATISIKSKPNEKMTLYLAFNDLACPSYGYSGEIEKVFHIQMDSNGDFSMNYSLQLENYSCSRTYNPIKYDWLCQDGDDWIICKKGFRAYPGWV